MAVHASRTSGRRGNRRAVKEGAFIASLPDDDGPDELSDLRRPHDRRRLIATTTTDVARSPD